MLGGKITALTAVMALSYGLVACGGDVVGGPADGGTLTGGGGPGNNNCQPPACVTNFAASVQSCAPMGTCVQQVTSTGGDVCWSNGTKEHVTVGPDPTTGHAVVNGPDGSVCFSLDFRLPQGSQPSFTYRDRFGQVVFTLTFNSDQSTTIECAGALPVNFPRSCSMTMPGMMMPPVSTMCTRGTCP